MYFMIDYILIKKLKFKTKVPNLPILKKLKFETKVPNLPILKKLKFKIY